MHYLPKVWASFQKILRNFSAFNKKLPHTNNSVIEDLAENCESPADLAMINCASGSLAGPLCAPR